LVGELHQGITTLLDPPVFEVWHDQLKDFVILDELPNPIRSQQNELVSLLKL
jgi:hypothetical protein